MIFDLTVGESWEPDRVIAEALYVGIATDTGFFRFNSSDAHAYRVAAQLVDQGAHPATVYQAVYERHSVQLTRLLGVALRGVRVDGGSIASVVLPANLIDEIGARDVDTSEIMTSLLAMDGISVALLFRELSDGKIKVSLRSKGVVDVRLLASGFGGGGHRNASGIVTEGCLEALAEQIIGLASQALAENDDRSAEQ
jgi:phosphoesterase RecJ-like protein